MPTTYISTYATGFNNIAVPALLKLVKDATIELELDGLLVYRTSSNINQIRQLRFFNNSFILLHQEKLNSPDHLHNLVKAAIDQEIAGKLMSSLPHRHSTFRVKTFIKNQPVSADPLLLDMLQRRIEDSTDLRLNKTQARYEFWCFTRSEGFGFYAVKITRSPNYEKTLKPGQLRPELAHLLCLMSEPKSTDVFLDPFAGHGSIPAERAKVLPAAQIIAGDLDTTLVKELAQKVSHLKPRLAVLHLDARKLSLDNHSVSKIVTDPPWGLFDKTASIPTLYADMLKEFHRVIKPNGLLVILTAQPETLQRCIHECQNFKIESSLPTLVSGRKATAFKLRPM